MTLANSGALTCATVHSSPFRLRPALPMDAAAIAAVHHRSRAATLWPFLNPAELDSPGMPERIRRWEEWLGTPAYHSLVAEANGRVAAFASWRAAPDGDLAGQRAAELHTLYVRPTDWGCNLGSTLLASALLQMRAWWHERAVLWVLEVNVRARRFYSRHGFELDGGVMLDRVEDGDPFVVLRYALPLSLTLPSLPDLNLNSPN